MPAPRAVLDRVVLIDMQVAAAVELEREAAVLGELLEHVIEKADAARCADRSRVVEVDRDTDARFARLPVGSRPSCAEFAHDRGPGFAGRAALAHAQAAHAEIRRELEIRVPVADHDARSEVHLLLAHPCVDEAGAQLAACAVVATQVRTDEHRLEPDALAREGVDDEAVRGIERRARKGRRAEPVLVGHHREAVAAVAQGRERSEHTRHEADLFE